MAEDTDFVQAEGMSPKEREEAGVYGEMRNWIRSGFRKETRQLVPLKGLGRTRKLTELARNLACRLYLFAQGRDLQDRRELEFLVSWNEKLESDLFNRNDRDSVVNCCRERWKDQIEAFLLGPISGLTLVDLIRSANPELAREMRMSQIATGAYVDMESKVDFIFRFEDRNKTDNREIVRLVQLKSTRRAGDVGVWCIEDSQNIEEEVLRHVSREDVKKMFKKAGRLEEYSQETDARVYLVVVPQYDEDGDVSNVFGIIDNLDTRDAIVARFKRDAEKTSFLPTEKS